MPDPIGTNIPVEESSGVPEQSSSQPIRVQIQSAEDFEKEAALFLERREAEERRFGLPQQKKKVKVVVGHEELRKEQIAVEKLGETNWIGKLTGLSLYFSHP